MNLHLGEIFNTLQLLFSISFRVSIEMAFLILYREDVDRWFLCFGISHLVRTFKPYFVHRIPYISLMAEALLTSKVLHYYGRPKCLPAFSISYAV